MSALQPAEVQQHTGRILAAQKLIYAGGVDLDLSQAAAEEIGLTAAGTDVVDVQVLDKRTSSERTSARAV
jgi:hypothetical protein